MGASRVEAEAEGWREGPRTDGRKRRGKEFTAADEKKGDDSR